MKKLSIGPVLALISLILMMLSACDDAANYDREKPAIDISFMEAFPINCDTLYFGEVFTMKMLFTDNMELGSFNIDIHSNFDHHSHSTDVSSCELDPVKTPVNPYTYIQDFEIDEGLSSFETNLMISLPASNADGSYDSGDYHFFVSLTDKEGWSTQKGLNIKILHR